MEVRIAMEDGTKSKRAIDIDVCGVGLDFDCLVLIMNSTRFFSLSRNASAAPTGGLQPWFS